LQKLILKGHLIENEKSITLDPLLPSYL